jgi:protein-S-isoprenylcysteine O-methyltransferase Ste14
MIGKILYALLFCVLIPLVLVAWAMALELRLTGLPQIPAYMLVRAVGGGLALLGGVLMAAGMTALWRRGGGLPMNAYPPPRFVADGVYALVPHPIYTGFGLATPGLALAAGSAAGVWIVTPTVWLGMMALVWGYERIDLDKRFGGRANPPWLWLPPDDEARPSPWTKLAAMLLALVPWLLAYEAIAILGPGVHAVDTRLRFERTWPVWQWTAMFYLLAYAWTPLAPLFAETRRELRTWIRDAWVGTAFIAWCFLVFPLVALPREFVPESFWGEWLLLDRRMDTPACAFPSFHVFWAFMAARLWKNRVGAVVAFVFAGLIAASCVTTGNHALVDVVAGAVVFVAAGRCVALWRWLVGMAERVANRWRDWRVGALRILNHGAYVAAAAVAGLTVAGSLASEGRTAAIITISLCGLAGAGLWGQWIEASSMLSRPFGYFGGLFGGIAGVLLAQFFWGCGWELAAAFAVAMPVFQGIGRLRCLVQGCCHGRRVEGATTGIRYRAPLSRVVRVAGLGDVPVYPTQLYSMISNIAIFGLLARLWLEQANCAFICGVYLFLSTLARFVEEAYRGEPQTPRWHGLAIYQWLAIAGLLASMILMALPAPPVPAWHNAGLFPLSYALPIGALTWFLMSADFPESRRRMSRLTP